MADGLVIKDVAVRDFLDSCWRSYSYISAAGLFLEGAAAAAGPNGNLKGALQTVEDAWSANREKLADSVAKLNEQLRDLLKKFDTMDEDMGAALRGRQTEPESSNSPSAPDVAPDLAAGPPPEPSLAPVTPPPLLDGNSGVAHLGAGAPLTPGSSPSPDLGTAAVPSPSAPGSLAPLDAVPPEPVSRQAEVVEALTAFARRWSETTGTPEEQVFTLMAAAIGAAGLMPAALLAKAGKAAERAEPGSSGVEQPGPSQPTDGTTGGAPEAKVSDGADLADTGATSPGEGPLDMGPPPEAGLSESPADEAPSVPVELAQDSGLDHRVDASATQPEALAGLLPAAGKELVDAGVGLTDLTLEPGPDLGGAGAAGIDLPPLDAGGELVASSASVPPLELPDLAPNDASSLASDPPATRDLPDLSAPTDQDTGVAGVGAAASMASLGSVGARGLGGLASGAVGGAGHDVSSGGARVTEKGREAEANRQRARDVLEIGNESEETR